MLNTARNCKRHGFNLNGLDDDGRTDYRLKSVGFVFQFYNLVASLTAYENVALIAELTGGDVKDRTEEVLASVGLADRMSHFPGQMSGGEQQRVSIARGLVKNPPLMLCDEPTTEQAIAALRLGVRDLLTKPFPVADLLDASDRALCGHHIRRDYAVRYHRMRDLVRKAVRERRELNKRIELVCKDLVGAHRRLAHRVVELGKTHEASGA